MATKKKTDRRTLYTIKVIKDALLKLTQEKPFSKITVAEICRVADITRSTFYLHFNSITDVLNLLLDDALELSQGSSMADFSKEQFSFKDLIENASLVPACQRIGESEKYQKLLLDPDLSEYIIGRIMLHEKNNVVPYIMKKTGLGQEDAETLFSYVIHGSFAVNRNHHFVKDQKWSHDVQLLNKFVEAGYRGLKK